MKKNIFVFVIILAVFGLSFLGISHFTNLIKNNTSEYTFLQTSVSPNGAYKLRAYRTEPGATSDYCIKVYLVKGKKEKKIYDAYHEESIEISWLDSDWVCINGKTLNISKNETYDWRKTY